MKRARIDLRVNEQDKQVWVEESHARGLEVSEAIRRALPLYFAKNPRKEAKQPVK